MRVLIRYLSSVFNVPLEIVDLYEISVVKFLNDKGTEVSE